MATNDKGAEPFVAIHNAMLKVLQVGACCLTCTDGCSCRGWIAELLKSSIRSQARPPLA